MFTSRLPSVSRISSPLSSSGNVPAGFVFVPAQFFQAQGAMPTDWQRNLYAAAFEQARRAVQQNRERMFQRSQFVAVN